MLIILGQIEHMDSPLDVCKVNKHNWDVGAGEDMIYHLRQGRRILAVIPR
jgi:hypothetical protein